MLGLLSNMAGADFSLNFSRLDEIKEIIDELVPMNQRGAKSELFGVISINGVGGYETDEYENVYLRYFSKFSASKNKKGEAE